MVTRSFLTVARKLQSPAAGTELMAPLLYDFVRLTRARTLLEVGVGYTTLFLLQALADNVAAFFHNRAGLARKTRGLLDRAEKTRSRVALSEEEFGRWMLDEPTYADPRYYVSDYRPRLFAFDDFSSKTSSAICVPAVAQQLGLAHLLQFVPARPAPNAARILRRYLPIDIAFNDGSEYESFLLTYSGLVNPAGGLLVLHNTVTAFGDNPILPFLRSWNRHNDDQFEVMSIVEPHKLFQGSCTVLRRICHAPANNRVASLKSKRWMTQMLASLDKKRRRQ